MMACGKCGRYRQEMNSISFRIDGYPGVPQEMEIQYCAECMAQIVKGIKFDQKRAQGNFNRREDYQVRRVRSRVAYNGR